MSVQRSGKSPPPSSPLGDDEDRLNLPSVMVGRYIPRDPPPIPYDHRRRAMPKTRRVSRGARLVLAMRGTRSLPCSLTRLFQVPVSRRSAPRDFLSCSCCRRRHCYCCWPRHARVLLAYALVHDVLGHFASHCHPEVHLSGAMKVPMRYRCSRPRMRRQMHACRRQFQHFLLGPLRDSEALRARWSPLGAPALVTLLTSVSSLARRGRCRQLQTASTCYRRVGWQWSGDTPPSPPRSLEVVHV